MKLLSWMSMATTAFALRTKSDVSATYYTPSPPTKEASEITSFLKLVDSNLSGEAKKQAWTSFINGSNPDGNAGY